MKKLGLCLFACLLLAGCSKEKTGGTGPEAIKVAVIMRTMKSPYYANLANGIKTAGEALGWTVDIKNADEDSNKEVAAFDSSITSGYKLIFLDAILSDPAVPSVNRAAEAGIPVIAVDTAGGQGAKLVTTVYSDNKENGRMVGMVYAQKLGANPDIVAIMMSGNKGSVAGEERRTGLFAGILQERLNLSPQAAWDAGVLFNKELTDTGKASNPQAKFSVVGQGWGNWSRDEAISPAENLITPNKNTLTVILGENDDMLLGALEALKNAGLDTQVDLVAAADGAKAAYDLIKQPGSRYFATGENSPSIVGRTAVKIAREILVDKKDPYSYPEITLTPAAAVSAQNVDEHYDDGF